MTTGEFRKRKLMESVALVMSPVDIKRPDLERFPNFAKAKEFKCSIQEGDVLYLPAFW